MTFTGDDPVRASLEAAIGFQYDILRLLGRGGMGAVYHAHERALDRPVAIKVLPPDVAITSEGRERFLREARTAARLTHPHIVPLFTFGETGGLVYFVMGYVDGESLEQRLRRTGKLDPAEAARILEQLAHALDYAHKQGVVHRDVKPDNVLLERGTGDAKLTDFGIAKRTTGGETLTGTGLLLGTPRYMSPEQASGDRDLDARSDVYSLGLVGYAMLAGRPPFDGGSVQEILTQQVTRDAPSLRKLLPDLPSSLVTAVEKALRKNPSERFTSAAGVVDALKAEEEDDTATLAQKGRRAGTWAISTGITTLVSWNLAWFLGMSTSDGAIWFSYYWALAPLAVLLDVALAKWKEKRSPEEIRRMLTQPPRWWGFWWPAKWRRRDDVWPRLPDEVRRTRVMSSLGIGLFAAGLEVVFLGVTSMGAVEKMHLVGAFAAIAFGSFVSALGLLVTSAVRSWRWGKRNGLTMEESGRFHSEPTAKLSLWTKPKYARFLAFSGAAVAAIEPQSPAEIAKAIDGVVRQIPAPQHDAVRDAANVASQLVAAIDALDTEIATLAREADPAEFERLEKRLAAPGNDEMRRLYASQLDLLRRLVRQRDEASARRSRYAELLRTLWLQVSALRAQQAADAYSTDVSSKIRYVIQSAQHEMDGMREAARLVTNTTG